MDHEQTLRAALQTLDLIGVVANAVLGGVIARSQRLDAVGFAVLAIASGLGGGMIRDVFLGQGPPSALTDSRYLATALIGSAVAYVVPIGGRWWERTFPIIDAAALGTWAAVGTQKSLDLGLDPLPAVMLGVISAVGGGAVRDLALGQRPAILGGNTLYASAALTTSAVTAALTLAHRPTIGLILGAAMGVVVRLLALWRGWTLPPAPTWTAARRLGRRG